MAAADGGNLNTEHDDDGVLGLRRGGGGGCCDADDMDTGSDGGGPSVGVVTLSDGLRGGV